MRVILAADHGGYNCKQIVKRWLQQQGYDTVDMGAHLADPGDDFPDYVRAAVAQFYREQHAKMIFWCRSGVGVDIAANRHAGIYCGLGLTTEQVKSATYDDGLNALAIAAEFTLIEKQKNLITAFLRTPCGREERFTRRRQKLDRFAGEQLLEGRNQCK